MYFLLCVCPKFVCEFIQPPSLNIQLSMTTFKKTLHRLMYLNQAVARCIVYCFQHVHIFFFMVQNLPSKSVSSAHRHSDATLNGTLCCFHPVRNSSQYNYFGSVGRLMFDWVANFYCVRLASLRLTGGMCVRSTVLGSMPSWCATQSIVQSLSLAHQNSCPV